MAKRIRDLPLVSPAEGLSIPVDPATGSTGRVLLGPTGVPAAIGGQFGVNVGVGRDRIRFHLARYNHEGEAWYKVLTVDIGLDAYRGVRGQLYLTRGDGGPHSIGSVTFSINRADTDAGPVALYIGVVPGLTDPAVTDAIIVGDPATGLYELWIYGSWLGAVEYHIMDSAVSLTYGPFTRSSSEPTGPHVLKWSTAPLASILAYGYIVAQSLSPTSGYVRWDNGVQVAWARVGSGLFGAESGTGTLTDPYRRSYTWAYPAAFAGAPTVQVAIETAAAGIAIANVRSVGSTSAEVLAKYGASGVAFTAHLYAVGRWRTWS